jgi:hypothetical protein
MDGVSDPLEVAVKDDVSEALDVMVTDGVWVEDTLDEIDGDVE